MSTTFNILIDPDREGQSNYARIIETYQSIDGPRSRLTELTFSTLEEAEHALKGRRRRTEDENRIDLNPDVEMVFYRTMDPKFTLKGQPLPAMSSMLYRVCGNDWAKFEEATRLIGLFIGQALKTRPATEEPTNL